MNTKALKLLSRFSYSPNKLGYCGLDSANAAFTKCLTTNECKNIPNQITHFKGLYPYLQTIAEVTGKDIYDYDVIEAYWLGNDLLKQFKPKHYSILIKYLKAQKLPNFFIKEIQKNKPKTFIPFHLFNVIHIGVGQITGSVKFNLKNINNCMVRWGPIKSTNQKNKTIKVSVKSLRLVGKSYELFDKTETVDYLPAFTKPKVSDTIAIHWKFLTKILTKKEKTNLSHWTATLLNDLHKKTNSQAI